jgi:hypothetical protein
VREVVEILNSGDLIEEHVLTPRPRVQPRSLAMDDPPILRVMASVGKEKMSLLIF